MKSKTKNKAVGFLKIGMLAVLVFSLMISTLATLPTTASAGAIGGKYYADFSTYEEAIEAAGEVNLEVSKEGNVLLKNKDNALPLKGDEYVSIFGESSSVLVGGAQNTNTVANGPDVSDRGAIYDSLVNAGFKVNNVLADYYAGRGGASNIGKETTEFSPAVASSLGIYNDVGVVVFSRTAGEGADANPVITEKEDNDYKGEDQGWKHKALFKGEYGGSVSSAKYDEKGDEYKHYLQLTESEEDLLAYVQENCEKVVVVLNTANAMEMYNLREDENIDGILLMGRPGETGHDSVGAILSGATNPSGKLVDEWNKDFTADPVWQNYTFGHHVGSRNMYYFESEDGTTVMAKKDANTLASQADGLQWDGSHAQQGYYGVDYEESIYLGYKYWETYYYEYYQDLLAASDSEAAAKANAWWKDNVAYSFGYGLSYSNFSFNILDNAIYATGNNGKVDGFSLAGSDLETVFASSEGNPATVKTLYIPVEVTNTGKAAGKEVVEVYVTAPYGTTAPIEKSFVTLAGYAKTDIIEPGDTQIVNVKVNVQDFSSFDYNDKNGNNNKGYELDKGAYTIRVMNTAHYDVATDVADTADAYDEVGFTLDSIVNLKLDDFSDNLATALFSDEMGDYRASTDDDHYLPFQSLRTAEYNMGEEYAMTLLSRSDMDGTFPKAPVFEYDNEGNITGGDNVFKYEVFQNWEYWNVFDTDDQVGDPWYVAAVPANWTQGTGVVDEDGRYDIILADMIGKSPFDGGAGAAAWDEFMNQLTMDELKTLVERQKSMWVSTELVTIGKRSSTQADSYNDVRTAGGTFLWTDSPTLAATWNTELAYRVGKMRGNIEVLQGWSGYGGKEMDTHRSPFSGRNAEYLSQDGLQGGYIAAAFTSGMESKGVTCYIKHFALNDMETNRDGMCNNVWATEQSIREINFKVFQMAMQEGRSSASMTGFARLCGMNVSMNHRMMVDMVCDEWGWEGFYITDGYSGVSKSTTMETMMRSHVIPLPLGSSVPNIQGTWDATLRDGKGGITVDHDDNADTPEVENATQYYYLRTTAMRILYADVNSNDILNGFVTAELIDIADVDAQQGEEYTANIAIDLALGESTAVYELAGGNLPDGVTLSEDGSLSGTPTEAGTFNFTVATTIDTWINSSLASGLSRSYALNVASAFEEDATLDAFNSAMVGEDFYAGISVKEGIFDEDSEIKYSLASGDLSEYGLTLTEDGEVEGTPTKTGTVTFTATISVGSASSSGGNQGGNSGGPGGDSGGPGGGMGGGSSSTEYSYTATITIGGVDPTPIPEPEEITIKSVVETGNGFTITFSDNTTYTIENGTNGTIGKEIEIQKSATHIQWRYEGETEWKNLVALEDLKGADGEDGAPGEDGKDGADGKDACSGNIGGTLAIVFGALAVAGVAFFALKKREN